MKTDRLRIVVPLRRVLSTGIGGWDSRRTPHKDNSSPARVRTGVAHRWATRRWVAIQRQPSPRNTRSIRGAEPAPVRASKGALAVNRCAKQAVC